MDRDCCAAVGQSAVQGMYHELHELVVRLDVWHLMRRFAMGGPHRQLYGRFMARECGEVHLPAAGVPAPGPPPPAALQAASAAS